MPETGIRKELLFFLKRRKRVWLTTILLLLAAFLAFIYLTESTAVLPFVYSLF